MADKALSLEGAKTLYNDLRARLVGLEGSGSDITFTVDSSLSATSINPVENRVIATKFSTIDTNISDLITEVNNAKNLANSSSTNITNLTTQVNTLSSNLSSTTSNLTSKINLLEQEHDVDVKALRSESIDYSRLKNTPSFSKVATSGSYSDLTGTPNLASVALTGNFDDLSTKPFIPSLSEGIAEGDSGYVTGSMVFNFMRGGEAFDPNPDAGYTYLPNGMLIQWGISNVSKNSYGNKYYAIRYPISFINTPVYTLATGETSSSITDGNHPNGIYFAATGATYYPAKDYFYISDKYSTSLPDKLRWFVIGY